MERAITGFHTDEDGDWVAHLDCGHRQHVRHRPPFQERPWVLQADGRRSRVGTPIECPLCDRNELPDMLEHLRTTPAWDRAAMPPGLKSEHRLAEGIWAVLTLEEGSADLHWRGEITPLGARRAQPIPPAVPHALDLHPGARFRLDLYRVPVVSSEEGGEPACYAHLACPECGAIMEPGAEHRPDCPAVG